MPNWVTLIIVGMPVSGDFEEVGYPALKGIECLCQAANPCPCDSDLRQSTWGTRHEDSYGIAELNGDGMPIMIQITTAWNEPSPEQMRKIFDLLESYGLQSLTAVACDPYDATTRVVEVADKAK